MKKLFEKINMTPKQVIDIALIALLLLFIGQNVQSATVKFLFFCFEMPLIIIIAISFFIGFFTAKAFSMKKNQDKNVPEDKKD
ncbi:MAG: hypothetical protein A2X05_17305 [Bacteroidetes bacterium GWE2_41_25]|nr:MAG: hypothetical protein A2X03_18030 [Bacteroidetes bacterium GWA2_40_15]OFX82618.1 MAG: hypothetical protein A2X06_08005 [Bacteroidetes bacterium GWC2_40_22]OFX98021.1 MAG: hypothetical protein A2X05_17305 [Bacteroidetes bacterium GWE2_41_25]OFY62046.1 MAG: hypothetical protein A2X04_14740 [Bacteroidetes bacterium GWF2_41_9]HBH85499.1 hypothetical protein [Bacteroidales bacterium]